MMTISTYKWTIDRYHQAIDSGIFDGQDLELLRGDLILMPSIEVRRFFEINRAS